MKNWNLLLRRTHLYLGLILLPWLVMYGVSTIAFNHGLVRAEHGPGGEWTSLWEKAYSTEAATTNDGLRAMARRILDDHQLSGAFGVQRQGQRYTINLPNFLQPTRVIYDHEQKRVRAERKATSTAETLARLHTRTGYGRGGFLHDVWAFGVDAFSVATLLWVATGLYLWWKVSGTRGWGFAALGGGFVTLGVLLATL